MQLLPLSSCIQVFGGGTPKTTNPSFWNGDIPWLSVVDFNNENKFVYSTEKTITEYGLTNSSTRILRKGDIIISARGTVGEIAILAKKMAFNQSCYGIRGVEGISYTDYIYYVLKNKIDEMKQVSHGGVFDTVTRDTFKEIEIILPPLPEQKAIAGVLGSLDDKIDLLQRQNATLEAMAETLFREKFISYNYEDSMVTIDSYILFNPKRSIKNGSMAPYVEMANLRTDAFCPIKFHDKEFTSGSKFINGDTLLARITPCLENGKKCFVNFLEDGAVAWGSTEYIVMRPMDELHPLFAYCLVKTDDFRGYAESCLSGSSGRQRVDVTHLKQYEIKSPRKNDINDFNSFCTAIEPKLLNNYKQIKTLEKLRDTLLPKLMSGEVRVRVDE